MENALNRVEPLPRSQEFPSAEGPWHRSLRVRLFAITFSSVLLLGFIYILLQPTLYRSSATVLMSAASAIDAVAAEADIQNVAIQRRILLGREITGATLDAINRSENLALEEQELRNTLLVDPVPDTNLVEMAAQGSDPVLLPRLVNTWIEVYIEARARDIEQSKDRTTRIVEDELAELAIKLEQARDALRKFREGHNIISAERQENDVLSRLDGLNSALNNAIEAEVQAGAHLDTLRAAVRRGDKVVPANEQRSLERLETELQALQGQMAELRKRYTEQYINKQPQLRAIVERIDVLRAEIGVRLAQYQDSELASAKQAHVTAVKTVRELERQLEEHKADVAEFSTIFATHQSLVGDLERLEELNRETQARLVQVEVRRVEKYPQVSVIDRPAGTALRIGPDYLLLSGVTVLSALGLGILVVWLHGFLGHKEREPAYITLSGVHMYPPNQAGLADDTARDKRLAAATTPMLDQQQEEQ